MAFPIIPNAFTIRSPTDINLFPIGSTQTNKPLVFTTNDIQHIQSVGGTLRLKSEHITIEGSVNVVGNITNTTTNSIFKVEGPLRTDGETVTINGNLDVNGVVTINGSTRPLVLETVDPADTTTNHIQTSTGDLRLAGDTAVVINSNLELTGTLENITTTDSTILVKDNKLVLNATGVPTLDTATNSGIIVKSNAMVDDTISLLWNKTDPANSDPYWNLRGGGFSMQRTIPSAQWVPYSSRDTFTPTTDPIVEYRWVITSNETLQLQKIQGRVELTTNNFDNIYPTGAPIIMTEFSL